MDVNEDNKITEHVSDLTSRKALWPADDTNLENSNNSEDGKILTRNVEHNVSIDEMSSNSEPYEEYKPESTSDSDEQAGEQYWQEEGWSSYACKLGRTANACHFKHRAKGLSSSMLVTKKDLYLEQG
ncbi:hypothetical protein CBL_20167 [Carabus blaptoides fortunei]